MEETIISHYQILQKLAEGGMGLVYKARDLNLPRLVVLKFLNSRLADSPTAHQRFVREANAIASLNHPNIATIYEFDANAEEPFLVLEFLPGGTLSSRLLAARRGLTWPITLAYATEMSEALAYAHRKGIVHRDIKPANALFAEDGRLKITDFGLAKLRGSSDLSQPGVAMGTLGYMSPEQTRGDEVDERSDIFSLGSVLYEMAAGERPFRGEREALALQILNAQPQPLCHVRPEIPPRFGAVVTRALEKDRSKRYQSMGDLLDDLRPLRRGSSSAAVGFEMNSTKTIPGHDGADRGAKRRGGRWLLAAAGIAVLFLLALVFQNRLRPIPSEKRVAVLPFRNINADAEGQAYCDGLMEILASKLTQLERFHGRLWVVPTTEVRGRSVVTAQAARRLFRVNLVVTGSLQRMGSRVLLTANLLDAETQQQLRSFDEASGDISALQDDLPVRVATMLDLELKPGARQALAAGRTSEPAAYDYYLQGYGYLRRYGPVEDAENAIRLFRLALDRDPNYALACAGLGEAYWHKYTVTKDPQWIEPARTWCRRALELNDALAPVHVAMGIIQKGTGHLPQAIREFRRAVELSPENGDAWNELAGAYEADGRPADAEATYKKAIQLQPGYWGGYSDLGAFYARYGRYKEAELPLERVIELTPDNPTGYRDLGGLWIKTGQYEKALEVLRKSPQQTGEIASNIGTGLFFERRYAEAVDYFERAVQLSPHSYIGLGNLADAYRWTAGRSEKASETYRRAISEGKRALAVNPNDINALVSVAVYQAKIGLTQPALTDIGKANQLAPGNTDVAFQTVLIYEVLGDRRRALKVLEGALKAGYSYIEVSREPELSRLRGDPRFSDIVRRLHLQSEQRQSAAGDRLE